MRIGQVSAQAALLGSALKASTGVPSQQPEYSGDVTQCQGYSVSSAVATATGGLVAQLDLNNACNAYGTDIPSLTVSVEYETPQRLHVHIYDSEQNQYQLPEHIWPRPARSAVSDSVAEESDLQFGYEDKPFGFWVTRKSDGAVLFDTRQRHLPTYTDEVEIGGKSSVWTKMPGQALVFEDQYLQLASKLPVGANIYGLGEAIAASGYRRNSSATVQTFWARDIGDPVDENMYGNHAMYMETRWNDTSKQSASHGVFLLNSNGMDVVLRDGVIQYRAIGGTLDFYFLAGPTPLDVASQYAHTVGLPQAMPDWAFGFHLCRWGYSSIQETRSIVHKMREAGIPLEVQWNDIDWMRQYRQFQFDQNYAPAEFKAFVNELHSKHQHYVPIIDAAIGIVYNDTDHYDLYERGSELGTWIRNPDGTEYTGRVWPGETVFSDWMHPKMQDLWTEAFKNFSQVVDFDGIWLDMNEPSSFIAGSVRQPRSKPSSAEAMPSGNSARITDMVTQPEQGFRIAQSVQHGVFQDPTRKVESLATPHDIAPAADAVREKHVPKIAHVNTPAYPIRNGDGTLPLGHRTISPNATHYGGLQEYSVHNIWGYMEEVATNNMLQTLKPGKRPFIISRSTFAGIGRKSGHWLGDNYSTWEYMKHSIQGVLQFNLFAIPMVGPDTCGFSGDADEELCNRWSQLSAFFPFYRNHNDKDSRSQEPFRWDSVRDASVRAIEARYRMIPYWLSLFADASQHGLPPVRALFYEFDDPALYGHDSQFMVGSSILVTPVLRSGETSATGYFPSADGTTWVDWWTHKVVDTTKSDVVKIDLPLGEIGVHVRSGSALLLYAKSGYTVKETKDSGYEILLVLDSKGNASGGAKVDDGISLPVSAQTKLSFKASSSRFKSVPSGTYTLPQHLKKVSIIGVKDQPSKASVNGQTADIARYDSETHELVIDNLDLSLNEEIDLKWE